MLEFVCSIEQRVGFMYVFNGRDPAMTRMNDQELTNLYRSPIFHIQHLLVSFWVPLNHRQMVSMGSALECILYLIILFVFNIKLYLLTN